MHESKDNLPVLLDAPGATLRAVRGGEMTVAYAKCAAGTDFTPVLKGLTDDMCQCPHWGYVLKGALHLRDTDGREETVRAGECGTRHRVTRRGATKIRNTSTSTRRTTSHT